MVVLLPLQVPIMLKSMLCSLKDMADTELMEVGECPFDQVRYPAVHAGVAVRKKVLSILMAGQHTQDSPGRGVW